MPAFVKRIFFGTFFIVGLASIALAGPEPMGDYSKGKNPIVEQMPVCDPRWYISLGGGIDVNVDSTEVTNGFDSNFDVLVPVFPGFAPARFEINSRGWNDAFDDAWRIQGEVGYVLTPHLEIFGLFKYSQADSSGHIDIGRMLFDVPTSAFPLSARFEDYSAWGGELGFRFFFLTKDAIVRPYIALSGGATHVDSIGATIHADVREIGGPEDFLVYDGAFFEDSWSATGAAMLGVEVRLACHWSLGLEGGVRYENRLGQDDSDFKDLRFFDGVLALPLKEFRPINDDSGDRLFFPVNGYVKLRF
jgi:hypothetical protein